MVATVSLWIKNIIFVVLFASFLELLLPNNSMQRFVRVIMGMLIMLAILNPVLALLSKDWRNEEVPALTRAGDSITARTHHMTAERDQVVQTVFKKDMSRQIRSTVTALEGVGDAAVEVEAKTEKMNLAEVHITVYIQPGASSKVAKVAIGSAQQEASRNLSPELKQKIQRTLMELYGFKEGQLEIKLWR